MKIIVVIIIIIILTNTIRSSDLYCDIIIKRLLIIATDASPPFTVNASLTVSIATVRVINLFCFCFWLLSRDGATRSGLFCAMYMMLEKINAEQEVDVFNAVRKIRIDRPQFVPSVDQYRFLYQMAQEYIDSFEAYANFK